MKTKFLKERLTEILYKIIKDAEIVQNFELKYCDKLTANSNLDMVIKVDLYMDAIGYGENQVSIIDFESCQVDKFEVIDENNDPVCSGSQIKELVIFTNEFITHFYSNL